VFTIRKEFLAKKDILDFPFEEIEIDYQARLSLEYSRELELSNAARIYRQKERYARVNAGSEEVDDSVPDAIPADRLDEKLLESLKLRVNKEAVEAFAAKYNIVNSWKFLGPQLLAYLAEYRLPSKNEICARAFLDLNVRGKPRELGLYRLITKVPRGSLMSKQVLPEHRNYSSLVPLYMAAQKKYNGISYNSWDRSSLGALLDKDLWAAVSYEIPAEVSSALGSEELLAIREAGLQGTYKGKPIRYNPETYHILKGISQSLIGNMPRYLQVMLTQIWVAHPVNRTELMILNCKDLDNMPEPLISTNVVKPSNTKVNNDIPYYSEW
jgi:hypothetical protein